jgi:ABC transport system ATP-binding/permease protein
MSDLSTANAQQSASLRESLENTLIVNTMKFFSVISKSDGVVSDDERHYVRNYLDSIYLPPVADYVFGQFERYIEQDIDLATTARQMNEGYSYENRVFILMKVYELASSDSMDDVERDVARSIGRMMNIEFEDVLFIEKLYDVPGSAEVETERQSSIHSVRFGSVPGYADVVLPYQQLDLEVLLVGSIYIIIKKNRHHLVSVGVGSKAPKQLVPMLATKIQHNQNVTINNYTVNFEDLVYYFKLKTKYLLPLTLYVSRAAGDVDSNDLILSQMASYEDILVIEFTQLLIVARPLTETTYLANNGVSLSEATYVNLNDNITVDGCPVNLRKLAFQLGLESQTFKIHEEKQAYTIGNQQSNDIVLVDESARKWQCRILQRKRKDGTGTDYVLESKGCPYKIYYNSKAVKTGFVIPDRATLIINKHIFKFNFAAAICTVEPFRFKDFIVRNLTYVFQDNNVGLDDISFEIDYGDLVAIMGPSGCGKSTLLNILNGFNKPKAGVVEINAYNLHKDYAALKDFLGYVPQDDLLFENLTVYENLYYNAKLRFPGMPEADVKKLVEQVLEDIDMVEKRNIRAGSPTQRTLSGGQRKRLNIGLELLAGADIYFLDEPTSGLSSKDSEKIIELLQRLTLKGKIIFVVIHQPSPKIYKIFDKLLLLDKGGKTAYFGESLEGLKYFRSHAQQVGGDVALDVLEAVVVENTVEPDLLLETLEEPLRDIDGVPLPQRKYSPNYWKEQFAAFRLFARRLAVEDSERVPLPPPRQLTPKQKWQQFTTLMARNFKNKVRDKSNLLITFLEAPVLALAVSFILRLIPASGEYSLFQNENLKIYIFLAVIISMFLAITNSVDEIIKDAAILLREKMLNIGNLSYYLSKFITLMLFAVVQNALFIAVSFPILQMQELYLHYLLFLTIVSVNGITIGLAVSSLPNLSSKAAFNIVPLVLIPQIIFGGALIGYEQMTHLKIAKNEIPEIAQLIPSRWSYEGLMTLQHSFNSFEPRDAMLQKEVQKALAIGDELDRTTAERDSAVLWLQNQTVTDSTQFAEKIMALDKKIVESQAAVEAYKQNKPALDSAIEANRLIFSKNRTKTGNESEIKAKIKSLQSETEKALSIFTEYDNAVAERDNTVRYAAEKIAADSAQYTQRMNDIASKIARLEGDLTRFQQMKPYLDSVIEVNRARFQKPYGNQEIARQIRIAEGRYDELKHAALAHSLHAAGTPPMAGLQSSSQASSADANAAANAAASAAASQPIAFDPTTVLDWLKHPLLVIEKPIPGVVTMAGVRTIPTVFFNAAVLLLMSFFAVLFSLLTLRVRGGFMEIIRFIFRIKPKSGGQSG